MNRSMVLNFFALLLLLSSNIVYSQSLPDQSADVHIGAASCAASTCHGALRPFAGSAILRNEFITWTREDRHARAYRTLLNKKSKAIARKMGIGAPHTEAVCLNCHASNIPKSKRGKKFQLSDGVGCESCHGGAEKWLNSHTDKKATHADNLKKGMYPTEDPLARGKLCLSCHYGSADKFVTHRIMGAGHPRLSFELDTFTELMPAHHEVDADYKKRKSSSGPAKTWALGQLAAVAALLQQLTEQNLQAGGLFPELSLFDCHSCHHPMSNLRWSSRKGTGLQPGVVRLQDAHLIMARILLKTVDQAGSDALRQDTRRLHKATTQGIRQVKEVVAEINGKLPAWITSVSQHDFSAANIRAIVDQLVAEGIAGEYQDYAAAEQTVMATTDLLAALELRGVLTGKKQQAVDKRLDRLYACVQNDEDYHPSCFVNNLKALQKKL